MAGRVKARRWQLEAWSTAVQGGRARWDSAVAWPWLAGVGWERELIGEAHASAKEEREDADDGRQKAKKKTYSAEYAKGAHGPSGSMKEMVAYGRGRLAW
jgi:hypothetical protein